MTQNVELAEKWNLPVSEADRIIAFADEYHFDITRAYKMYRAINRVFEADVIKSQATQKYYGVLRRSNMIIAMSLGFDNPSEAAESVNESLSSKKLDWRSCYRLGTIPAARRLIKSANIDRFLVGQSMAQARSRV